jgi:hypothetical protein
VPRRKEGKLMSERIEALCEAATPGPWNSYVGWCSVESTSDVGGYIFFDEQSREDDRAFIAHARQLLPLMLDVVKASRAEYDEQLAECDRKDCEWLPNRLWGKSFTALDNYCAEHLPERSEG